jgi:aerobic-type carbon monoxide dehydrogenase small subunit (CoxS/CutS family)
MAQSKSLNVNGRRVSVRYDDPQMPLLYALRDNLGLHGPRFGCGLGQCGACTVHIDRQAHRDDAFQSEVCSLLMVTTVQVPRIAFDDDANDRNAEGNGRRAMSGFMISGTF